MSRTRRISTRMWRDEFFNALDPSEKLLFIYCLTAPDTNLCGIYEIPKSIIAVDTGLTVETINLIFERFEKEGKILYRDGWIAIKNFMRYQNYNSPMQKNAENDLIVAPARLKEWIDSDESIMPSSCEHDAVIPHQYHNQDINQYQDQNQDKNQDVLSGKKQTIAEIIEYLNLRADTKYRQGIDKTRKLIEARLNEGFALADFKIVIDKKCAEWLHTDMQKFIRPETLFGTKFESYLNQQEKQILGKNKLALMRDIAKDKLKEIGND